MIKDEILQHIGYTELVYERINKKLKIQLSKSEIEALMLRIIQETDEKNFVKKGKNYYISNFQHSIRITINSYTFTIITIDRIAASS